ncbi:hypothetical protein WMY93_015298 [Mugilogobius chulae]|uniref:Uncharacterized protein n=1 Tax=Mugilogobius chulae TaxID=88201 RepID=A0AAW0NUH3_9GOBI
MWAGFVWLEVLVCGGAAYTCGRGLCSVNPVRPVAAQPQTQSLRPHGSVHLDFPLTLGLSLAQRRPVRLFVSNLRPQPLTFKAEILHNGPGPDQDQDQDPDQDKARADQDQDQDKARTRSRVSRRLQSCGCRSKELSSSSDLVSNRTRLKFTFQGPDHADPDDDLGTNGDSVKIRVLT